MHFLMLKSKLIQGLMVIGAGFAIVFASTQGVYADNITYVPETKTGKKALASCGLNKKGAFLFINAVDVRNSEGNIRVKMYDDKPENFLEKGQGFRVDVKTKKQENFICMPMPVPGYYAAVVLHDMNANGKVDILTDGFGGANNPKFGLSKPKHKAVRIHVPSGVTAITVKLNYVFGRDEEKVKRRRKLRRN